jgi:CheY-like chemotaxis protein
VSPKTPVHLLHFTVEDSGPGIEPDEIDKVFEAFVRARAGVQSGEGTGLGLSLSRQFARLMGGDMAVRNVRDEIGHGAVFDFSLRIKPVVVSEYSQPQQTPKIVGLAKNQAEVKVLVVDDSWDNRQLLLEILRPLGCVVKEADDGHTAIEMWHTWRPNLILMDIQMPNMNGYDATREILKNAIGEAPVIIAVTASAFSHERESILEVGCRDFIRKPVHAPVILASIQKHLAVEYVYQASEKNGATAVTPAQRETATAVVSPGLSPALLERLEIAASQADMGQIEACIEIIQLSDANLAAELQRLADEFEYTKILARLQNLETNL